MPAALDASAPSTRRGLPWLVARSVFVATVTLFFVVCATVGLEKQCLVSKSNMQLSEVRAFGAPTRIASQLEPGRVVTAARRLRCARLAAEVGNEQRQVPRYFFSFFPAT